MSITKDFEKHIELTDELGFVYSQTIVTVLLNQTRALELMLKRHEFCSEDVCGVCGYCPECGGDKDKAGHSTDCQLAKLLEGVE